MTIQTNPQTPTRYLESLGNRQRSRLVLPLLILLGVLFSLGVQAQIPDEVYFSGDGGLKALMTRQFSAGQLQFDLDLPATPAVRQLWQAGFYPFAPPFVYAKNGTHFITFPIIFSIVSAPFYHLLGSKGLYWLPLFSTCLIWVKFYQLCRQFELRALPASAALAVLIFASPLTLYSTMFWEHSTAVALAFWGVATMLAGAKGGLTARKALLSGALIGLAAWFRPEFLYFAVILVGMGFLAKVLQLRQYDGWLRYHRTFAIGVLGLIGLFFGLNQLVYGYPLGIHGIQFIEESLVARLRTGLSNLIDLTGRFGAYFPISLLLLLYGLKPTLRRQLCAAPLLTGLLLICGLFILSTAMIVPPGAGGKQWGARFLLILVPLIGWVVALLFFQPRGTAEKRSSLVAGILAVLCIVSFGLNTVVGAVKVSLDYRHNVLPTLTRLRQEPSAIIVGSTQIVAQEFYPGLYDSKFFFTAENEIMLKQLMSALLTQGQKQFLFVCYGSEYVPASTYSLGATGGDRVQFNELERDKLYTIYRASISP